MSYRFLDGTPVKHGPLPGAEPCITEIIIQRGAYQCAVCGGMLQFEPCKVTEVRFSVGFCASGHECGDPECGLQRNNCRMWKVRLKVPLERLQVEIL